jgi:DNA-binding transcriptional LysR family regulator
MSINHIELRHLRYFIGVAEERSFTRAAARLHISQPPLSRQIMQLEEALDVRLFRRTKRSVDLTDAGTHFLKIARQLLRDINDEALRAQAVARGEVGELKIGLLLSASLYPDFAKKVRRFRTRYPHVRLAFKEAPYDQGTKLLYNGEVDLCFQRPFELPRAGKILYQTFYDDYLQLCLSRHHPLARKKSITVHDLKEQLLLLNPDQMRSQLIEQLQRQAHKAGFLLRVYQDTVNFPVIANLVAAEYGMAFLPPAMSDAAHGEIVFRNLVGLKKAACYQPIIIAYRRESESVALKNFLGVMRAI